jgi:hypothetical protein
LELREAIARLLGDAQDVILAQAIFGETGVDAIARRVESLIGNSLGSAVSACLRFTQSVGAVFVLELDQGRLAVLKAHPAKSASFRSATYSELVALYNLQEHLARKGFPCARVLVPPTPWPGGVAVVMEYRPAPGSEDPHTPPARGAMARGFAQFNQMAATLPRTSIPSEVLPEGSLFPTPHNPLFDFTRPGAEWIHERARSARQVLESTRERRMVLHSDFSAANVMVKSGDIVAVYDMDSVATADEMIVLARTATHFTYRGDTPWTWPSRDESIAFVADYLAARCRPLDARERRRLNAAAIYTMAYTAKCEHGMRPEPVGLAMGEALRTAAADYFG